MTGHKTPSYLLFFFLCFSLPAADAPRVYVRALTLGCFRSLISIRTFRRALTVSVDNCAEIKSTPSVLVEFGRRCLECVGVPWREQLAAAFLRQSPCIDSLAFLRQSLCINSLAFLRQSPCKDSLAFLRQSACKDSLAFLRQSPCIDSLEFLRQSPCINSLAFLRQSPCIDSLAFLRQSPCIDSLALKALTRTASGKESSRNTENEVTKKAWHKRLQQLIHFTGTMPDRVLTVSERASYYCRQQRTLRMSVIPGGGDSSVVRAPHS